MEDLGLGQSDGWRDYDAEHVNEWVSCFGTLNADAPLPVGCNQALLITSQKNGKHLLVEKHYQANSKTDTMSTQ